jgi:hypothetical protein
MAASTTVSSFDAAMKQIYRPSNVENLTYRRRPLFGMLAKNEGFGGRNQPIVIQYGNPAGGRSATFATAQANRSAIKMSAFLLTRVSDYQICTIDSEVIEATRGDTYAFLSALKQKTDSAFNSLSDAIESALFRSGSGALGQIGSISANVDGTDDRIVLLYPDDVTNFEVDMELVCSATDGSAVLSTPGSATITKIDRTNGYLQVDDLTAGTDWDDGSNYFLYVEGDAANAGANVKVSGLNAWMPTTVSATTFFGVNRSYDTRLQGMYFDSSSDSMEDAVIDLQSKIGREGGAVDTYICHNSQYRRLIKELGAKKIYADTMASSGKGEEASIGYRSVVIDGDYGEIRVVPANKCPVKYGYGLQKDTWTFHTLGAATKFLMEDGLRILRQASTDGYEMRMVMRGNLACTAPVWNGRHLLPTP